MEGLILFVRIVTNQIKWTVLVKILEWILIEIMATSLGLTTKGLKTCLAVRTTGVPKPSQRRRLVQFETLYLRLPIWKLRLTSMHGEIYLWSLSTTLTIRQETSWSPNSLELQHSIRMSLIMEVYRLEQSKVRGYRPCNTQRTAKQVTGCFTNWESTQCHQSLEMRIQVREIFLSKTAKCCKVFWKRTLSGSTTSSRNCNHK